jgi:hypothetical protein
MKPALSRALETAANWVTTSLQLPPDSTAASCPWARLRRLRIGLWLVGGALCVVVMVSFFRLPRGAFGGRSDGGGAREPGRVAAIEIGDVTAELGEDAGSRVAALADLAMHYQPAGRELIQACSHFVDGYIQRPLKCARRRIRLPCAHR